MNQEIPNDISTATVRNASVADIPAMMRIAGLSPTASQWPESQYFELFASGAPERISLVIEQDSNVAGFLVARHFSGEYEIENIVISVAKQRQGLGAKLFNEFMKIPAQTPLSKIFLEVRESNEAARRFYIKFGFRKVGERNNYYQNPQESAVLYEALPG